jgi:hypothetical protein
LGGQRVVSGDHPTGAHQEWAMGAEMMGHFFFSNFLSRGLDDFTGFF